MGMRSCFTLVLLLAGTSVFAQQVQVDWDENYDFDNVRTFQWYRTEDTSLARENPFMHSRVLNAIEYRLTQSGLTEVEENPDIFVTYHTQTKTEMRMYSDTHGYRYGGWYRGYAMAPTRTTTRVVQYEKGTLVIDIWDAKAQELVWRGSIERVFSDDPKKAEKQVAKGLEKLSKRWRKLYAKSRK